MPLVSKKKWINDKLLRQFEALTIHTKTFQPLFFASIGAKKSYGKETPGALTPRRRHYAWDATFKKVDETTGECGANIVRDKSQFRTRGNCFPL